MKYILLIFTLLSAVSLSAQTKSDYEELTDTKPHDGEQVWSKLPETPQISWGSVYTRYAKNNVPTLTPAKTFKTNAWRGERVNVQAVIWSKTALRDLRITADNLVKGTAVISADNISPSFVRYVMTDELNKDGKGACGHRADKSQWDSSMVADLLYKPELKDVKACTAQPLWLTVKIPPDAMPGVYKGAVTVKGTDFKDLRLMLEVKVSEHVLPSAEEWAFHLDLWQNPYSVARYYDVPLWSDAHFEAMRPVMKRLADAGQKVITATIMHKPWNGQTEDYFSSMVAKIKRPDGSWQYDYTVFDRWVEFMMSVGINRQINCYTLIPWALKFDYYDLATNSIQFIESKPGDAEYAAYWGAFLKDFAQHLRSKGWFDRTTIAMDERGLDAMREAIKVIRNADPAYKISLAGSYHEEIEADLYDYCIGFGNNYPPEIKSARLKAHKISTYYTCCAEPRPNTFTFSPLAESTWLGWHAAAGNYDGYLRWAYNSWTSDPLRDTRFRTWAAGDCYLVYPEYSSMRMELLTEGIQDYEKIRILRSKLSPTRLKALEAAVNLFKSDNINSHDAAKNVEAARKILNAL